MSIVLKRLHQNLKKRQVAGNLRTLSLYKNLVDFSSNDYLGLAGNKELQLAIQTQYTSSTGSIGATGSRLLTGNSDLNLELESSLADFFQAPAALLFNSGYTANLALLSTIPQRGDTILYDQAIHSCIKDGARLSNAKYFSFKHNDMDDLERKLKHSTGQKFIVVESLYSMEGDNPPIEEVISVAQRYDAEVFIDEAHTTGWEGRFGTGWVLQKALDPHFLARVYTFGKGPGVSGACVVGSQELIDYLINFARPFIYTTAMPSYSLFSISSVLEYLKGVEEPGNVLKQRINQYLNQANKLNVTKSLNHHSPVQWIMAPGNRHAIDLSEYLVDCGFDVRPILSPTVPEGKERLRICIHAFNSPEQISELVSALDKS